MFWTLYDPLAKRDGDGSGISVSGRHLPRPTEHAAPRTAESVLFLLEDTSRIADKNKAPLYH